MFHAIFLATGEALKPERDPPGVLTGRTGKKEAPWVGLPRLPSFPTCPCASAWQTVGRVRCYHNYAADRSMKATPNFVPTPALFISIMCRSTSRGSAVRRRPGLKPNMVSGRISLVASSSRWFRMLPHTRHATSGMDRGLY